VFIKKTSFHRVVVFNQHIKPY